MRTRVCEERSQVPSTITREGTAEREAEMGHVCECLRKRRLRGLRERNDPHADAGLRALQQRCEWAGGGVERNPGHESREFAAVGGVRWPKRAVGRCLGPSGAAAARPCWKDRPLRPRLD